MTPEIVEPANDPMEDKTGQDEYQEVYNEFYESVKKFMMKAVGEEEVHECTNTAFEKIYEQLAEPQPTAMMKAFVFRVAGEVAAQTLQQRSPE